MAAAPILDNKDPDALSVFEPAALSRTALMMVTMLVAPATKMARKSAGRRGTFAQRRIRKDFRSAAKPQLC